MAKWECYAAVVGTKYLGQVDAETEEEAKEKALELDTCFVSVCHQCSSEVGDIDIDEITVEASRGERQ